MKISEIDDGLLLPFSMMRMVVNFYYLNDKIFESVNCKFTWNVRRKFENQIGIVKYEIN